MPLSSARREIALRFGEPRSFLAEIKAREISEGAAISLGLNVQKGLFLVALYAAFEFSITRVVTETAELITRRNVAHAHIERAMFSLALDPELRSVAIAGRTKKWDRRLALFERVDDGVAARIYEEAILDDLSNVWCSTLDNVLVAFGLPTPSLYDPRVRQYIDELVERRNAVAHGRESASEVGARYNAAALDVRASEVKKQKDFIIDKFENFVRSKLFVLPAYRGAY